MYWFERQSSRERGRRYLSSAGSVLKWPGAVPGWRQKLGTPSVISKPMAWSVGHLVLLSQAHEQGAGLKSGVTRTCLYEIASNTGDGVTCQLQGFGLSEMPVVMMPTRLIRVPGLMLMPLLCFWVQFPRKDIARCAFWEATADASSCWVSSTHLIGLDWVLESWLWVGLAAGVQMFGE